jgi:hypothetical protein
MQTNVPTRFVENHSYSTPVDTNNATARFPNGQHHGTTFDTNSSTARAPDIHDHGTLIDASSPEDEGFAEGLEIHEEGNVKARDLADMRNDGSQALPSHTRYGSFDMTSTPLPYPGGIAPPINTEGPVYSNFQNDMATSNQPRSTESLNDLDSRGPGHNNSNNSTNNMRIFCYMPNIGYFITQGQGTGSYLRP